MLRHLLSITCLAILPLAGCASGHGPQGRLAASYTPSHSGGAMPADPDPALDSAEMVASMRAEQARLAAAAAEAKAAAEAAAAAERERAVAMAAGPAPVPGAETSDPEPVSLAELPSLTPPVYESRMTHSYFYYPTWQVYYAPHREVYFWPEGEEWQSGATLPARIHPDLREAVLVKMGTERPYERHERIRAKHGPR